MSALRLPGRNASVAARARHHFATVTRSLSATVAALRESEAGLEELAREYRAVMAPCRLILYLKRSRAGRPKALYWGCGFRYETPEGELRRWRNHLRGRLTPRMIFAIAQRYSERKEFFRYERRRLAVNAGHAALARELDRARKALTRMRIPEARLPKAPTPPPPADLSFDPALVEAAWRAAWACAAVEGEMLSLPEKRRGSPFLTDRLFPYARVHGGYISLGWGDPETIVRDGRVRAGRRHVADRLTWDVLEAYRIPATLRPALREIDRRMAALRREHARYARAFGVAKRVAKRSAKRAA